MCVHEFITQPDLPSHVNGDAVELSQSVSSALVHLISELGMVQLGVKGDSSTLLPALCEAVLWRQEASKQRLTDL